MFGWPQVSILHELTDDACNLISFVFASRKAAKPRYGRDLWCWLPVCLGYHPLDLPRWDLFHVRKGLCRVPGSHCELCGECRRRVHHTCIHEMVHSGHIATGASFQICFLYVDSLILLQVIMVHTDRSMATIGLMMVNNDWFMAKVFISSFDRLWLIPITVINGYYWFNDG